MFDIENNAKGTFERNFRRNVLRLMSYMHMKENKQKKTFGEVKVCICMRQKYQGVNFKWNIP